MIIDFKHQYVFTGFCPKSGILRNKSNNGDDCNLTFLTINGKMFTHIYLYTDS